MQKDKFGVSSDNIMVEIKVSKSTDDDSEVTLTAPLKNASFLMKLDKKVYVPDVASTPEQ